MKINGKEITGLKKAVGAFNNWVGYADLVLDTETGELITFEYVGQEIVQYKQNIKIIATKGQFSIWSRDNKTTIREVKDELYHLFYV